MNELVFISDLHLHPEDLAIQSRFNAFIEWAKFSTKKIYILGDFFHVWVGDDSVDDWSSAIAKQLYDLKKWGISVYYMHGNRDFLLGSTFAKLAGWEVLWEPTHIELDGKQVLLMHGDGYCTLDHSHQRFRWLTRNRLFPLVFLSLPLKFRKKIANAMREHSMGQTKSNVEMDVVASSVIQHMLKQKVTLLIHGHTHKPGFYQYKYGDQHLGRYVLSDWDDMPQILSYNKTVGFFFKVLEICDAATR